MPVFWNDTRSVLFVHIPKAAGSTLEQLFRRSGWQMAFRATRKTEPALMAVRRCSPQHYHAALLAELFDVERFDAVFTVTREPISRFRSEYLMRNRSDPRTDGASVEAWAQRVLARRSRDPYALDNHLRPQSEFILPRSQAYRLEDGVDSVVADLNARFDLSLTAEIPRAMHSVKRAGVRSEEIEVSTALEQELRTLYAQDFDSFGY